MDEFEHYHAPEVWSPAHQVAVFLIIGLMIVLTIVHVLIKADRDELDSGTAVIALALNAFVGFLTLINAKSNFLYWLLFAIVFLGILVPLSGKAYTQTLHRQLDDRYIEKCRLAVQFDSRNAGAHALLAHACSKQGHYDEAVAHFEQALILMPNPETNPEHKKWVSRLEAARAEKKKRDGRKVRR